MNLPDATSPLFNFDAATPPQQQAWHRNLLHLSVLADEPDLLARLLMHASPEQVNARDILGCTPATYAAFLRQDEALELLVKHGADLDIADNAQHSARFWQHSREELICPRPISFISVSQSSMAITTEARALLQSLTEKELVVVGIVGKYRSGKSFLLNRLLAQSKGFDVSSSSSGCTRGVWLWGSHLSDGRVLLLLDTEGLSDPENENQADTSLFVLTILLSSLFILNIEKVIDSSVLNELSFVGKIADVVRVSSASAANQLLSLHLPKLLWLVRDVTVGLEEDDNVYLKNRLHATNRQSEATNEIRARINTLFPNPKCVRLVRPMLDELLLANMESTPYANLRPEFRKRFEQIFSLARQGASKAIISPHSTGEELPVDGALFLLMVEQFVNSLNEKKPPVIEDTWATATKQICQRAAEKAFTTYRSMIEATRQRLPLDDRQLADDHQSASRAAMDVFECTVLGPSASEYRTLLASREGELLAELQNVNYSESRRYCDGLLQTWLAELKGFVGRLSSDEAAPAVPLTSGEDLSNAIAALYERYHREAIGPAREEVWSAAQPLIESIQERAAHKFEIDRLRLQIEANRREAEAKERASAARHHAEMAALRHQLWQQQRQHQIEMEKFRQASLTREARMQELLQDATWQANSGRFFRQVPPPEEPSYESEEEDFIVAGERRCGGLTRDGKRCLIRLPSGRCHWHENQ